MVCETAASALVVVHVIRPGTTERISECLAHTRQ